MEDRAGVDHWLLALDHDHDPLGDQEVEHLGEHYQQVVLEINLRVPVLRPHFLAVVEALEVLLHVQVAAPVRVRHRKVLIRALARSLE